MYFSSRLEEEIAIINKLQLAIHMGMESEAFRNISNKFNLSFSPDSIYLTILIINLLFYYFFCNFKNLLIFYSSLFFLFSFLLLFSFCFVSFVLLYPHSSSLQVVLLTFYYNFAILYFCFYLQGSCTYVTWSL